MQYVYYPIITSLHLITDLLDTCLPHGDLINQKCQVAFNIIIPENIERCPYFLFTSHGIHMHPPPPPTKTPLILLEDIRRIIHEIRDPDLRTGTPLLLDQFLTGS